MSLHPQHPIPPLPKQTARIAHAAFRGYAEPAAALFSVRAKQISARVAMPSSL